MSKFNLTSICLRDSIGMTFAHNLMTIRLCRQVFASLPSEQAAMLKEGTTEIVCFRWI